MKSINKAVYIEWRYPKTPAERALYGLTEYENKYVAKVFINTRMGKRSLPDTFFHEMAHVFFAFHSKRGKLHHKKEEALAEQIGKTCAYLLK